MSHNWIFALFSSVFIIFTSCQKDVFLQDKNAALYFSQDTVSFDTVFTSIGSATYSFMVYNHYDKAVKIAKVQLMGGSASYFRINVDGVTSNLETNVEIAANDSIRFFVQVMVDPTQQNAPLMIADSILLELNENIQFVQLRAWGQDVHLLKNQHLATQIWENDKPYVVYDTLFLDTAQTLTINKGVQIYFHKKALFQIKGTLIANGTLDEPIAFRGDRLDQVLSGMSYDKTPGQWFGMFFKNTSTGNKLNYCSIRNATIGIYFGEISEARVPDLQISNCKIENHSATALFATNAKITAFNCLLSNSGGWLFYAMGGEYEFTHCTFANYYDDGRNKESFSILLSNFWRVMDSSQGIDTTAFSDLKAANFTNCIVYGSNSNELYVASKEDRMMNYKFENCLLKIDKQIVDVSDNKKFYKNVVSQNAEHLFKSTVRFKTDFELDTLSIAKDRGNLEIAKKYPTDYNQRSRIDDNGPDLGAFERLK